MPVGEAGIMGSLFTPSTVTATESRALDYLRSSAPVRACVWRPPRDDGIGVQ